jgi:hypothetical protein
MADIKASDIAAWWGAGLATIVLLWDVYKWRSSRVNLRISAQPYMQSLNPITKRLDDDLNIYVEVVNNGDKTTTLTHLMVKHYRNTFDRLRGKTSMQGLVPNPGGGTLPFELGPGKRWTALMDQKDLEAKSGTDGYLYCGIAHSAASIGQYVRVKFEKRPSNSTVERDARKSGARPSP